MVDFIQGQGPLSNMGLQEDEAASFAPRVQAPAGNAPVPVDEYAETLRQARKNLYASRATGMDPLTTFLLAASQAGPGGIGSAISRGGIAAQQAMGEQVKSNQAFALKDMELALEEGRYKDTLKQRDAERISKAQDKTAEYVAVTDVDGKTTNIDKNSPSGKAAIEAILSRGGTVLGIGTQKPERDPLAEKKLRLEIAALENKGNELNLPEGTGESFLNALPEQLQSTVKAIAEGRLNPNQLSARNDYRNHILAAVTQYDPNFDARDVLARFRTEVDYSVGKPSQSINAANTLLGHLTTLDSKIDNLDNKQISGYNTVANWISKNSGNPQVTSFLVARKAVVNELERVFKGTGGSLSEIRDWESAINSAGSTAQLKDAVKTAADLMESRTEALSDNYERVMGKRKQFISPKGIAALEKIKGQTVEMVDPKGTIHLVPLSLVESAKKDGLTEREQ